jgi:hypothetical protein
MIQRDSFAINFGEETLVGLVVSESHGGSAMVATHPVSGAAEVTDHYRRQPETLSLSVIICDYPIAFVSPEKTTVSGDFRTGKTQKKTVNFSTSPKVSAPSTDLFSAVGNMLSGGEPTSFDTIDTAAKDDSKSFEGTGYGGRDFQREALEFLKRIQDAGGACQVVTGICTYDSVRLLDYRVGKAKENSYATLDVNFKVSIVANTKTIQIPRVKALGAAAKKDSQAKKEEAKVDTRSLVLRLTGSNPESY